MIGALGSNLSALDYWRSLSVSATSLLGYSIPNIPTTFEHVANPAYTYEINGNLWTLLQEVRMYIIIPVVLRFRLLAPAVVGYGLWLWGYQGGQPHNIHELGLVYCWAFLVGSAFYVYRDRIRLDGTVAALCAVGAVVAGNAFVSILCVAYAVMWFALRARPVKIAKYGDLSYGIYIYGFPVQQIFSSWFPGSPVMYVGGSLICTIVLAALSWRYVERPALALKENVLCKDASVMVL
jgi:peptidoglycan/LPS O-acetylase OafA/YrhL